MQLKSLFEPISFTHLVKENFVFHWGPLFLTFMNGEVVQGFERPARVDHLGSILSLATHSHDLLPRDREGVALGVTYRVMLA